MADIYGVETLSKNDIDEIISLYTNGSGYYGPVIEKNGKYYLTTLKDGVDPFKIYEAQLDGTYKPEDYYNVSTVLNRSISKDELLSTINNTQETSHLQCSVDDLSAYISEVESTTGKEIKNIDIVDNNKVNIVFYGENNNTIELNGVEFKKETDANGNNKYNIDDILNQVGVKDKNYSNEKLNNENKRAIENYINQLTEGNEVNIEQDENGNYVAIIKAKKIVDGKEVTEEEKIVLGKDVTLSEAVYKVNEVLTDSISLKDYNKDKQSNKSRYRKKNQRIFIDVEAFNSVQSSNSSAKSFIEQGKSGYQTGMLTDKLASFYNGIVGGMNPTKELSTAVNLLTTLNSNIKYSLQAYDNIDHKLGALINSIIAEIFAMNSYKDDETKEFYESDLKEREDKLAKIIENLAEQINNLKEDYEKKYPGKYALATVDTEIENLIMGIANSFGFTNDNEQTMPALSLLDTVEFINKNGLLDKLDTYSGGSDWQASGLAKLYYDYLDITKNIDSFDEYDHKIQEKRFLQKYLQHQDIKDNNLKIIKSTIVSTRDIYGIPDDDLQAIKAYMHDQIDRLKNLSGIVLNTETGKNETLTSIDLIKHYADDCKAYDDAIATAENQKRNYEIYQKIMPYEVDMKGDLYLEYLTQDWSKYSDLYSELGSKLEYMSQSEIALYCMYKGIPLSNNVSNITNNKISDENANGYLESLSDIMNQRRGISEASERYEQYVKWSKEGGVGGLNAFLKSGVDGVGDGVESFFAGIANCFASDGVKSYQDYRDMYMLSLLDSNGQNALDMDMDPNFKALLKRNYTVFKSVGTMAIPTLVSFVPTVGPYASRALTALSSYGNQVESARQGGSDAAQAYLYGGVSALSTLAMNRLLSGIRGLNGNVAPVKGVTEFISSMGMQGGRAIAGSFVDALWRSTILNQPVDLSNIAASSFDTAINGILTAAALNGTTKLSVKIADGLVHHFSDTYNSYQELLANNAINLKSEIVNSELFQKLRLQKFIGGDNWNKQKLKYDKTIVGHLLEEDNYSKENLSDVTNSVRNHLNVGIKPGQRIIYDNEAKNYYIYDKTNGTALTVPGNWISLEDTPWHITPTLEEQLFGVTLRKGEEAAETVKMNRWANETLPELLKEHFGISDGHAKRLVGNVKYYTSEEWKAFLESKGVKPTVTGLHNNQTGFNHVLVELDKLAYTMHDTLHEAIHGLGKVGIHSINEAITELFALNVSRQEGILPEYSVGRSLYQYNANVLDKLVDAGLLSYADLGRAYVRHDINIIKDAVNSLMGDDTYFDLEFRSSFDKTMDPDRNSSYREQVAVCLLSDLMSAVDDGLGDTIPD